MRQSSTPDTGGEEQKEVGQPRQNTKRMVGIERKLTGMKVVKTKYWREKVHLGRDGQRKGQKKKNKTGRQGERKEI